MDVVVGQAVKLCRRCGGCEGVGLVVVQWVEVQAVTETSWITSQRQCEAGPSKTHVTIGVGGGGAAGATAATGRGGVGWGSGERRWRWRGRAASLSASPGL